MFIIHKKKEKICYNIQNYFKIYLKENLFYASFLSNVKK